MVRTHHHCDYRLTFVLGLDVTREYVEGEQVFSNLLVRYEDRMDPHDEAYLTSIISIASSKPLTAIVGRMGPNISLKPHVRMAKCIWGNLSYSTMSESSGLTPLTIVGAMYLVGGSVSPPETIVPLVSSNNALTRAKWASVGARAKVPFEVPRGGILGF